MMEIRLAYGNSPPERNGTSGLEGEPTVRLVAPTDGAACGDNQANGRCTQRCSD